MSEADLRKATSALVEALDHHLREQPLLDEVHYAKEIVERVLGGASLDDAWRAFMDPA